MTINERISKLRQEMQNADIDAYIIPSNDPHQSEYVAEHWKSREWISGFTGSAGVVVVTQNHAGLWTDSRYFLQAENELATSEMVLHKQVNQAAPEFLDWLLEDLDEGSKIGCYGMLFSKAQATMYSKILQKKSFKLIFIEDLINKIWTDRPSIPQNPVFQLDTKYAGQSRKDKIEIIRGEMNKKNTSFYVLSTLDDIAWTFNIRGSDVECNPVVISYAVIGSTESYIFVDDKKVPADLKKELKDDNIFIKGYYEIESFLKNLPPSKAVYIDPSSISVQLFASLQKIDIRKGRNIIKPLKAIKNKTEISYIKKAMVKDGIALTKTFMWLEKTVKQRQIPETEVAEKLAKFRKEQGNYHGESFDAIVGYKSNGAIIHYGAIEETCANIKSNGILLVDSGGQYNEGTTDITRTITLGKPTREQKRNFTLVLKGHIELGSIIFPKGTKGVQLDTLARMHLWKNNLNYGHGTGHGVGFFLNVHEPPQGFIAGVSERGTTAIEPGMFTSNEPGFYKTGEYGIRIENLVICVEDVENEYGDFLKFETLTLFPIDQKLIVKNLLNKNEKNWLNNYHNEVYNKISPHLNSEEKSWLKEKCKAI